jgi:hypothetical protein
MSARTPWQALEALRRGSGKRARELELERQVNRLRSAVTATTIEAALLK